MLVLAIIETGVDDISYLLSYWFSPLLLKFDVKPCIYSNAVDFFYFFVFLCFVYCVVHKERNKLSVGTP